MSVDKRKRLGVILAGYKYNNVSEVEAINQVFSLFNRCVTCGGENPVMPGVPWGRPECEECRAKTGKCLICRDNRNDCCC